jgi:hypothetical protein
VGTDTANVKVSAGSQSASTNVSSHAERFSDVSQNTLQLSIAFPRLSRSYESTCINFVENDSRVPITSLLTSVTVPMTVLCVAAIGSLHSGFYPSPAAAFERDQQEVFTDAASLQDNSVSGSGYP